MFDEFMLRVKVKDALNSPACRGICFQAAGVSIMGYHYGYLVELINRCSVDIKFGVVNPSADAEYDDHSDTLRFKSRDPGFYATLESRAQIVHECTHAIIDVTHSGRLVRRSDNEAIAWIAQTIYTMLAGGGVKTFGDFFGSLAAVASDAIETSKKGGVPVIDPKAVSFIGAILRAADEKRARDAGKTLPDLERMNGIPY